MTEFNLFPKQAWTILNAALKKPAGHIGEILSIPLRWIKYGLISIEKHFMKNGVKPVKVDYIRKDDLSNIMWTENIVLDNDMYVVDYLTD